MYLRPAVCAQSTHSSRFWLDRTLASLTSIGRFTPEITSTPSRLIIEIARLLGVPPNMSVSSTTPSPVSTWRDARLDLGAPPLHVVVRTDADGGDVPLRADDVLHRGAKLFGQTAMGHQHEADHDCLLNLP